MEKQQKDWVELSSLESIASQKERMLLFSTSASYIDRQTNSSGFVLRKNGMN